MPIVNFAPATRAGAHMLIQLYGPPRSGKTYTALRLARGIAGPKGKIGMLDTEAGRGRLYSDKVAGGFEVGELTPPFTPRRYIEAISEALSRNVSVLVIDSFSHVWAGTGGVLEMADQAEADGKKGLLKWLEPKRDYKRLVNFLLSTRMHIILCSRAKQPVEERIVEVDGKLKKTLVTLSWEPIQDRQLKYEMTIAVPMTLDGAYETDPSRLKVPGDLASFFGGDLLTEQTGAAVAEWVAGGSPMDPSLELLRKEAFEVATAGTEFFTKWWNSAPVKPRRNHLRSDLDNLASIAREADAEAERQRQAEEETRQAETDQELLDDPFASRPIANGADRPARRTRA
jgi:hypothetical protein